MPDGGGTNRGTRRAAARADAPDAEPDAGSRAAPAGAGRRRRARRGEGERLREEIVAAASRMLAETGEVGELSLRAVAREVGIATTSIYLHFPSLGELILAVKTSYFAEFGEFLHDVAEQSGQDPRARVRAVSHAYVRYGLENRGRYLAMFSSESLPRDLLPAVGYIGVAVFEEYRDELAAATGPGRDANMLAIHAWTALHGIVMLRASRAHFPWPDLDEQIDDLMNHLVFGRSGSALLAPRDDPDRPSAS